VTTAYRCIGPVREVGVDLFLGGNAAITPIAIICGDWRTNPAISIEQKKQEVT
jgi:hypothetical protein